MKKNFKFSLPLLDSWRISISAKVLRKGLLKFRPEIGPPIGHFYNPGQVKTIIDHLGMPLVWLGMMLIKVIAGHIDDVQDEHHYHAEEARVHK